MKHARPIAMLLLFILLCASLAYWGMRAFTPAPRPQAPAQPQPPAGIEAAGRLLGGNTAAAATSSHYQLQGVINAGSVNSVAILSVNAQPARATRLGGEIAPGVTLSEVHAKYVLLSENGAPRRVDLTEIPKKAVGAIPPTAPKPASAPQPAMPSSMAKPVAAPSAPAGPARPSARAEK
ncbi:MAG: type II secretion system protein N [Burkholderiaceae bacterium]|nr:type II secretion system protein N [Burkholderiaceae bacterium]